MGDLSYWSANSLFKQTSHSRNRRAVVRGSQSESNYISWTWAHLFFKKMELILRSACILAFVPLSIQLCPLWPGFEGTPFKKWDLALIFSKLTGTAAVWHGMQYSSEDGSLLLYWNLSELHSSGHFTSQPSFNISSSISHHQSSYYREQKQSFPWKLRFRIYPWQTLSASVEYSAHSCSK